MSWYDGLLGRIDPSTAGGGQLAGLLNGLGAMGAGLVQAGQFRPVSQPGPSVADAFAAFGTGRQQGLLNAYQTGQMNQKQRRQALIAEAKSTKPDADISAEAQAMRRALSGMPEDVRTLAGPDELPGLAVQRATQRQRPMTAEEMQAAGLRPGTAAYTSDWTGNPNVLQQPDYKSPEAEAQAIRIAGASRAPPQPVEVGGKLVDPRTGRVVYDGGGGQPLSPANAWNDILRYAPAAAAGQLDVNSREGQRYLAAQTILTQPQPVAVTQPDQSVKMETREPNFPFPRLSAPAQAGGTAAPGTTTKPPPPLSESQGKANMFGQAMEEGDRIISETGAPSMAAIVAWRNLPEGGINPMLSAKDQKYFNALRQFSAGVLRKETGAAFTPNELLDVQSRFFAMPGDSSEVLEQKARARRIAIEAMRAETGGFRGQGAGPPAATGAPLSGATPPPAPVRVRTPEEARRLPSGTPIILPDGTQGRVP